MQERTLEYLEELQGLHESLQCLKLSIREKYLYLLNLCFLL